VFFFLLTEVVFLIWISCLYEKNLPSAIISRDLSGARDPLQEPLSVSLRCIKYNINSLESNPAMFLAIQCELGSPLRKIIEILSITLHFRLKYFSQNLLINFLIS